MQAAGWTSSKCDGHGDGRLPTERGKVAGEMA